MRQDRAHTRPCQAQSTLRRAALLSLGRSGVRDVLASPNPYQCPSRRMVGMLVWDKRGETRLWRVASFHALHGCRQGRHQAVHPCRISNTNPWCVWDVDDRTSPTRSAGVSFRLKEAEDGTAKENKHDRCSVGQQRHAARLGLPADEPGELKCRRSGLCVPAASIDKPARQLSGRLHLRVPVRACMSRQTLPR